MSASEENAPQESDKLRIDNPKELLIRWRQSDFYQKAHDQFFAGKDLVASVTPEEKSRVFEESSEAKKFIKSLLRTH